MDVPGHNGDSQGLGEQRTTEGDPNSGRAPAVSSRGSRSSSQASRGVARLAALWAQDIHAPTLRLGWDLYATVAFRDVPRERGEQIGGSALDESTTRSCLPQAAGVASVTDTSGTLDATFSSVGPRSSIADKAFLDDVEVEEDGRAVSQLDRLLRK